MRPGVSGVAVEGLESRALLSGAASILQPDIEFLQAATGGATVSGFAPAQIRHAYGFDDVTFAGSSVAADGAGQTIAIIDAYNHPNIASDLAVFSNQFGLPAANLTVVNQTGGSHLPTTDAGWAGEIALDVEWAHAIAPAASILLVEATSATDSDLMAAVNYARHAPGVSALSMSWGGSEFFSFFGNESQTQLAYDDFFTTPAGHGGVTFVASAGDTGFNDGVQWPSSSPNVVAVGGTSLHTQDASGTYLDEGPWRGFRNGTSGGFSQVEAEPQYQQTAQQTGARSTPDVGYNGDPNTGFAVYDSVPYQGSSGWDVVGGTSAGAPQWAALIAIANQGRALAGKAPLDGPTGTLPDLYSVYSAPGTSGYSAYTAMFNDVGSDGYGYTTGLGTPRAAAVISSLVDGVAGNGGGSGTVPPAPAQLPASPLTIAFSAAPSGGIGGESETAKLRLTNASADRFSGPVTITLYASTDGSVSSDDRTVSTLSLPKVNLRPGGAKKLALKFTLPTDLADGSYDFIASATADGTNTAPAEAAGPTAVAIETPKVDLSPTFADGAPIALGSGRGLSATVTVLNSGNVAAVGTIDLALYTSADGTLDTGDSVLTTVPTRKLHLRPGKAVTFRVRLPAGTGSGFVLAAVNSSTNPADENPANDVAATPVA